MNDKNKKTESKLVDEVKIEQVPNEVISLITKAEIDIAISTAHAFPRSLTQFIEKATSMATISENVAESCTYALPRGQDQEGNKKILIGPSVRLAEICCTAYKNIRSASRVVANDGKTITAQGICHDLETNNAVTVEVKRKITNKYGKTYSEDMQVVTGNAACAIAYRNAVFKVIPAALIQDIWEAAQEVAKGTADTLVKRRDNAVKFFKDKGITEKQICEVLEVQRIEDIDLEKLSTLRSMKASVNNNEASAQEIFKEQIAKLEAGDATKKIVDDLKTEKK